MGALNELFGDLAGFVNVGIVTGQCQNHTLTYTNVVDTANAGTWVVRPEGYAPVTGVAGNRVAAAISQAKPQQEDLAWLDRRVAEMCVAL